MIPRATSLRCLILSSGTLRVEAKSARDKIRSWSQTIKGRLQQRHGKAEKSTREGASKAAREPQLAVIQRLLKGAHRLCNGVGEVVTLG